MNKKIKNVRLIKILKLVALFLSILVLVGMTSVSCVNDKSPASTEPISSATPDGSGEITYWRVLHEGSTANKKLLEIPEVIAVASGTRHDIMFGLDYGLALKSDGTVWSWNINVGGSMQASEPIHVSGLSKITAISTGMGNSLALDSDGKVWYWYAYGDLPVGTTTIPGTTSTTPASRNPTPMQITGLSKVTAISSGLRFSLVLLADGTVWAWGENEWGQLGDGTVTDSDAPVQVKNLSGVIAISAGHYHSLALKADGTVWAWGDNESGELGNGTTINSYVPVQVSKLDGIAAIEAGEAHSLALRKDGTVWSWGNNENGQTGNGTQNGKDDPAVTTPVKVNSLSNVVAISEGGVPGGGAELNGGMVKYGAGYCLALKSDGTVWTWGASGWYSEPWNNPHNNSPVQVESLGNVSAIVGGGQYAMVISSDTAELGEELDGTQWKLVTLNGNQLVPGSYISLYFREEGTIWGYAGCNYFGGDYSTSGNGTLRFSELTMTLLGCADENIGDQEKAFLDAITAVVSCSLEGNHLEMYDDTGRISLVFEQLTEYAMDPSDLVGTRWTLASVNGEPVMTEVPVIIYFESDSSATGEAGSYKMEFSYQASEDNMEWYSIRAIWSSEVPSEEEMELGRYTGMIAQGTTYILSPDRLEVFTYKGDTLVYELLS